MEADCKELLHNQLALHSSGGADGVHHASRSPSYPQHAQQMFQQKHQHTQSHKTPELSLCNAQTHVHHHLCTHEQDPHVDNMPLQCMGACRCAEDDAASVRSPNMEGDMGRTEQTGNMEAELLEPHAPYSMHAPQAARPMNGALHHQENLGILGNPSISEDPAATPPQPSGTMHTSITLSFSEPSKKRKGRARKYMVNAASSIPQPTAPETAFRIGDRGQMGALVQGLTPYVITIARGEDVSLRITLFQQEGHWGICVLSALGSISNVTLRHSETCSGAVTYEGCYDILALSGSLAPVSDEGFQNMRGGLMVSLAGLDGRVFGGEVAGTFIAGSPIKVVVGTFLSEAYKSQMQVGDAHNASQAETARTAFPAIPFLPSLY